jgi:hypothetical protein
MIADVFGDGLAHRVALYVPGTTHVSETLSEVDAERHISGALRFLSEQFGGATALSAQGSWVTKDGALVTEQVTIVYAFSDTLTRDKLERVHQYALWLKLTLKQEAVAVEIDGALHFV